MKNLVGRRRGRMRSCFFRSCEAFRHQQLLLDVKNAMKQHFRFDFTFPRNYEIRLLEAAPPVHPVEKLHHYPVELEEGDRNGVFLRVAPRDAPAWLGFFAQGFESGQVVNEICSAPDPDWFCATVGGYAYIVKSTDPAQWLRMEQRPVVDL